MNRVARGFTFIELLVVLAILMVIFSIATPYYLSATQRAHEAAAVGYLRALRVAQETYHITNSKYAGQFADLRTYLAAENLVPDLPHEQSASLLVTVAFAEPLPVANPPGSAATPPPSGGPPAPPDSTVTSMYIFYLTSPDAQHWQCSAEPLRDRLNSKYFYIDETGVIRIEIGAIATRSSPQL